MSKSKYDRTVTQEEFLYFKEQVFYWQTMLGLTDYDIRVYFSKLSENVAECEIDNELRIANITLSSLLYCPPEHTLDKKFFNRVAFHEMGHILVGQLIWFTKRKINTISEEHAILHRLETLLLVYKAFETEQEDGKAEGK